MYGNFVHATNDASHYTNRHVDHWLTGQMNTNAPVLADTRLTGSFSRSTGTRMVKPFSTRMVRPFWILMKQEMTGWQWHHLDHMPVSGTLIQTDNHASTSSLNFYRPWVLFLTPNQQCQSTEGKNRLSAAVKINARSSLFHFHSFRT